MSELNTPSTIARETLRRLALQRIQPTPENFRTLYNQIAGLEDTLPFPSRPLQLLAQSLPRSTPEQLRSARQFEAALSGDDWPGFTQHFMAWFSEVTREQLAWSPLIRDILQQYERRQAGLNSVTKQDALRRVLESSADAELLHTRLSGLVRSWAQQPGAQPSLVDTALLAPSLTDSYIGTETLAGLGQAPERWRKMLADTLETALGLLLVDSPELGAEATELARMLRSADDEADTLFGPRIKEFAYRVQWIAQDQSDIRQALLGLLQLLIENIGELGINDSYLQGQLNTLLALFQRPLDKHALRELSERLREVIFKQGTLKRSLDEAQLRVREMLSGFISGLDELASSAGGAHTRIADLAQRLEQTRDAQDVAALVGAILAETQAFEVRARDSQDGLQNLRHAVDQANREIARLEGELQAASELIRHDALTGSLNRKGLEEMFARERARAERRELPLSIAMLDVDDFKQLNDTLGHSTGDEALRHLARVIRECLRPQDSVGRYGGEEFLLLLPETRLDEALAALRRLQRELTRRFFLHDNQRLLITFSAGVAEVLPGEDPDQTLRRADQAMYRAKRGGKNRVEGS